jgi:NADH dehydrogenase
MNNHDSKKTRIVVLGAGYAGLLATLRLAGKTDAERTKIILVNDSDRFVERIRLHQVAATRKSRHYSIGDLIRGRSVDFVNGRATALDRQARDLRVECGDESRQIGYDYLLYALGSSARNSGVPGAAAHSYSIGRAAEAAALGKRLADSPLGTRVAVIGGGLTGIETSTEIAERYPHLRVRLLTEGQVGAGLSERGRRYLEDEFFRFGIGVDEGRRVAEVLPGELHMEDGSMIPYDICVWAGSFAVSDLAREAGLQVNKIGQAIVDPFLRSVSDKRIYAAGDSACFAKDPGAPIRMACATAMPMGAQAADNLAAAIADKPQSPFNFAFLVQCISLGRHSGLVQMVNKDDTPKERIISGRKAAFIKESICRSTVWSLKLERLMPGAYRWPGAGKVTAAEAEAVLQT